MAKHVEKIRWCNNHFLRIKDEFGQIKPGGHYVFVRKKNKNGSYSVSTFTSLDDKGVFKDNQLIQVRKGNIYPIPVKDANFSNWTGLNRNSIVVSKHAFDKKNSKSKSNRKVKRKHYYMFKKK